MNKPGQKKQSLFYCPLHKGWIDDILEVDTRSSRWDYDEKWEEGDVSYLSTGTGFSGYASNAGWKIPEQLLEAILVCLYCDCYCLGKSDGPNEIPAINKIDRFKLLDLLDDDHD